MINISELKELFLDNGERPITNKFIEELPSCFQFAYKFSKKYIKDKTILDFGCGGGYGSEYLSRFTSKSVIGYDINKITINKNKKFFNKKNLRFISDIKLIKNYDIIVCFQVIEHISKIKHNEFIKYLSNHLELGGKLILATPNKKVTSTGLKKPIMVFHEYEFTSKSLLKLLKESFYKNKIYGQLSKNYKTNSNIQIGYKITKVISQIDTIRHLARHIPMFIKKIFMNIGSKKILPPERYLLTQDKKLIDKSLVLISISQK